MLLEGFLGCWQKCVQIEIGDFSSGFPEYFLLFMLPLSLCYMSNMSHAK